MLEVRGGEKDGLLYDFDSGREANVIYARVMTSGVIYVCAISSSNN